MTNQSKGNFFNFIEDAAEDDALRAKMTVIIEDKGRNETPETLLTKFHDEGYDGVSLRDTIKILEMVKKLKDPKAWDWSY